MSIGGQHIQIYNSGSRTYEIDIPYDVSDSALKDGLKHSINGFDMVDVYRRGEPRLSAFWIISYIGFNGDIPDPVFDNFGLTGGKEGTIPSISYF